VRRPGTYFFSIPHQVTCQIPFINIRMMKKARSEFLQSFLKNRNTTTQNKKNVISKVKKNRNDMGNNGNFRWKLFESSSME
jgi:hypothetical protein